MRFEQIILTLLCIIAIMLLIFTVMAVNAIDTHTPSINGDGLAYYEPYVEPETVAATPTCGQLASDLRPTCGQTASEPSGDSKQLPEGEVLAMAQAMYGECYESEYQDMLRVGMAICNRVDDPRFPVSVTAVCAQPGQIHGYNPYSQPAEICLQAAREVLDNWYAIKAGEARSWEYGIKYWTAGGGTTNVFREEY